MVRKRRNFSAEDKVRILRLHLLEKQPVSDICQQYDLNPNMFYRWQKQLFENGTSVFEVKSKLRKDNKLERNLERMKAELAYKDGVIAEIIADHIRLKKSLGPD